MYISTFKVKSEIDWGIILHGCIKFPFFSHSWYHSWIMHLLFQPCFLNMFYPHFRYFLLLSPESENFVFYLSQQTLVWYFHIFLRGVPIHYFDVSKYFLNTKVFSFRTEFFTFFNWGVEVLAEVTFTFKWVI